MRAHCASLLFACLASLPVACSSSSSADDVVSPVEVKGSVDAAGAEAETSTLADAKPAAIDAVSGEDAALGPDADSSSTADAIDTDADADADDSPIVDAAEEIVTFPPADAPFA